MPVLWKTAVVVPITKTEKVYSTSDLRPISILPVASKLMEKAEQLQLHISENRIPPQQSGFRRNFSTATALHCLCKATDERKISFLILLDLSKAFDSLSHILFIAILNHYKISNLEGLWFTNYLKGRKTSSQE